MGLRGGQSGKRHCPRFDSHSSYKCPILQQDVQAERGLSLSFKTSIWMLSRTVFSWTENKSWAWTYRHGGEDTEDVFSIFHWKNKLCLDTTYRTKCPNIYIFHFHCSEYNTYNQRLLWWMDHYNSSSFQAIMHDASLKHVSQCYLSPFPYITYLMNKENTEFNHMMVNIRILSCRKTLFAWLQSLCNECLSINR